MKKLLLSLCLLLAALLTAPVQSHAENNNADELKQMGVFLSNFMELRFMNVDYATMTREGNPDLIRFGIWHNYLNNFRSRIEMCDVEGCRWGSLRIHGKYVRESLKKYLDYDLKECFSVDSDNMSYHFDGSYYHFEGADGEASYYAQPTDFKEEADGTVSMKGHICDGNSDEVVGSFTARAKHHLWQGKKTWALLELKSSF